MAALGYALQYPEHVSRLVLAAGVPSFKFLETAKENFAKREHSKEQAQLCEKLWNGGFKNDAELLQFINAMGSFYSYKKRNGLPINRPQADYPYAFEPLNQGFGSFLQHFNFEDQLHKITCETLILVGQEDWITDAKYSIFMSKYIPNNKLKIFPKADHSMEADVPELYFTAIQQFVRFGLKEGLQQQFLAPPVNPVTLTNDSEDHKICRTCLSK